MDVRLWIIPYLDVKFRDVRQTNPLSGYAVSP